jgi:transcriptional repressor of cell division inhibition gene dicB
MSKSAIDRAFELLGGPSAVARLFPDENGKPLTPWAVSKWRRRVPAERVLRIEELTEGKVSRYELRPDIYGESPKRAAA